MALQRLVVLSHARYMQSVRKGEAAQSIDTAVLLCWQLRQKVFTASSLVMWRTMMLITVLASLSFSSTGWAQQCGIVAEPPVLCCEGASQGDNCGGNTANFIYAGGFCDTPAAGEPGAGTNGALLCRQCGLANQPCCPAVSSPVPCTARVGTASCISGICVANGDGPGQTPTPSGGGGGGGGGAGSRRYQQCGGKYYDGPTNCGTGLTCQQANDYYSQCLPDPKAQPDGKLLYEQCGGQGYSGDTRCAFGANCVEINPFYSQCRED